MAGFQAEKGKGKSIFLPKEITGAQREEILDSRTKSNIVKERPEPKKTASVLVLGCPVGS